SRLGRGHHCPARCSQREREMRFHSALHDGDGRRLMVAARRRNGRGAHRLRMVVCAAMQLRIEQVGKRYGRDVWALREFSLDLAPGVLGLLGPNGAGKSTLMRILATVTRPTEGHVTWNGEDIVRRPDPLRETLGYLPQDFGVYPNLTAQE